LILPLCFLPFLALLLLLALPAPAGALTQDTFLPDATFGNTAQSTQAAGNAQASPDAGEQPDPGALIARQVDQLNLNDLEGYAKQVDNDLQTQLSDFSLVNTLSSIRSGQLKLDPKSLLEALAKIFFQQVLTHVALLGRLLVLGF
jgi:hypothetical protein